MQVPAGAFSSPENDLKNYVSPCRCPQGLFRTQKTTLKIMYLQAGARRGFFVPKNHHREAREGKSSVSLMREATF